MATFYHNPRCSKSRQALALLEERKVPLTLVLYLDNPPDQKTLQSVVKKLGIPARGLLRKGEEEYQSLALADTSLDDNALIAAMCQHPRLIERPIFVNGDRAAIGRPPEQVLDIL